MGVGELRYVSRTGDNIYVVSTPSGAILGECYGFDRARELAYAPDMLALLKRVLAEVNGADAGGLQLLNEIWTIVAALTIAAIDDEAGEA